MITILYTLLLVLTGTAAGFIGALTGIGGALVITPVLSILFGIPLEYAVGISLVSTIATSGSATIRYIKDGIANIKIGLSLEIATTVGAIIGALSAVVIYSHNLAYILFVIFGATVLLSIYPTLRRAEHSSSAKEDWSTRVFQLKGSYRNRSGRKVSYAGVRWWIGEGVMFIAGIISGLLGVGAGVLKVLGMDSGMRLPIKVSTATSDFMIGVTAVTGSAIYFAYGYIHPLLAAPVILGVFVGAFFGSKVMEKERGAVLRYIFITILAIAAVEMILRGLGIA